MTTHQRLAALCIAIIATTHLSAQLPTPSMENRGLWVTQFRTTVLGDTAAENQLLDYVVANEFTYLICTNTFQILDGMCPGATVETAQLRDFIAKAHAKEILVHANVGSGSTAERVEVYNKCSATSAAQRFDGITYECEFYNDATNGSCEDFEEYYANLEAIRDVCDSTSGPAASALLAFEVYIGGEGSTGDFVTNVSNEQADSIAMIADRILLTYYRSSPSSSGGNFFNWTIERLMRLASAPPSAPTEIVLLFKSRDTDANNMFDYLLTWPGSHFDALRDPWRSWVEGTTYNSSLTDGYIEQFTDGTHPWLSGTHITGYTWFEHAANLQIADSLTMSVGTLPTTPVSRLSLE